MDKLLLSVCPLEFDVHAASLKIGKSRTGGNFPVALFGWKPDLQVIGLGRGKSKVTRAERHYAVRDFELIKDLLCACRQQFESLERLLRFHELDQLHFIELVVADEPLGVLSIGTRLPAEAG